MANAKKLPSGNWRVNAYIYTDDNGKKIYKSFTAPTKKEAEYMASVYKMEEGEKKNHDNENITFGEAYERYLEIKGNVLSPSTYKGYKSIGSVHFPAYNLSQKPIYTIDSQIIQRALNHFSLTHSPKSVRNLYGLITAILSMFRPEFVPSVQLPQKQKPLLYLPSNDDIITIVSATEGKELGKAIMLAAFGSLRRSEICALTAEDVNGDYITINKALVSSPDGGWVVKPTPKTYAGYRTIEMPRFVIDLFPESGRVVNLSPDSITHMFNRLLKRNNISHFRFHDLRHYQASVLHAMGIPDKYIIARGGWQSDHTLKNIYQHTMDKQRQEIETRICCEFSQMIQPKRQHKRQHEA